MNVGYIFGIEFSVPTWVIVIAGLLVLYYIYMTWHFNVFKKLGVPGPKPVIMLGTMNRLMKGGFRHHDMEIIREYGPICGTFAGRLPVILVADIDILKEVFVKDFNNFTNRFIVEVDEEPTNSIMSITKDERWKSLRNVLTPVFTTGKMKQMIYLVNQCSNQLLQNVTYCFNTDKSFDIKEYAGNFTMDVIARTAFGLEIDSQKNPQNDFVKYGKKAFDFSFKNPAVIIGFFFPFLLYPLNKLGLPFFPKDVAKFFMGITDQAIQMRKQSGQSKLDFLQLMIDAHKDHGINDIGGVSSKKKLTEMEVYGQCIMFFLAGYETTANTIAFTFYNLATNQHCQDRLVTEIDHVLRGQEPTYECLSQLPYMDQVISETLRLYPQAPRIDRVAKNDVTIKGVKILKDMIVMAPIFILHRDPNIWPDPDTFNPDRFTPEEIKKRDPYYYLPFGVGPRSCIGFRLAQMEIKVSLIKILQHYRIVTCSETQIS